MEDITILQWLLIAFILCFPVGFLAYRARQFDNARMPAYESITMAFLSLWFLAVNFLGAFYSDGSGSFDLLVHLSLLTAFSMLFAYTIKDVFSLTRTKAQNKGDAEFESSKKDTEAL